MVSVEILIVIVVIEGKLIFFSISLEEWLYGGIVVL